MEDLGKYIKNEKNKLEKICSTDALTGTGNRRAFNQIIDRLWEEKSPCAIGFIDIDGLKACNDNYGHSEGDRYIQLVSDKLRSCCKMETIKKSVLYGCEGFYLTYQPASGQKQPYNRSRKPDTVEE